jgi:glutamate racemase
VLPKSSPTFGEEKPTIGVMDSGIGGLSVLSHLHSLMPGANLLYFADQAHIPYGPRPVEQIQLFASGIVRFLIEMGADMIVVACNTASAAALDYLRHTYPHLPIVGMEPAVKPAAATTRTAKVGVLATPGTFNSHRYAGLMTRYAAGIEVYEDACSGLVQLIESGNLDTLETRSILERAVTPMLAAGIDTLVLGCTHYPFVIPLLKQVAGDGVAIIDPAPAVARHARNVLQQNNPAVLITTSGTLHCFTSGDEVKFAMMASRLLDYSCMTQKVCWQGSGLMVDC